MGIFNEILEGQLNQLLTKRLAMQGGAPAPALQPEIVGALVLENDRPEWSVLTKEGRWCADFNTGATAAEQSWLSIINPASSGVLAVVTRLWVVSASNTVLLSIVPGTTPPGAASAVGQASMYQGARLSPGSRSPLQLGEGTDAAVSAAFGSCLTFPAVPTGMDILRPEEPFILWPGSLLIVYQSADEVGLSGNVIWRTRALSTNELMG